MFDGGYESDIETVRDNVREAEIVTFYFPLLRKTLLIDTRTLAGQAFEGSMPVPVADAARLPLVRIVPMARSSAERFESLRRLRPEFDRPESITMIPWPRRVESLRSDGVWELLIARLEDAERAAFDAAPEAAAATDGAGEIASPQPVASPDPLGLDAAIDAAFEAVGESDPKLPVLAANRLFERLIEMEAGVVRDALSGVGHRTLWGVGGAGDEG